MIFCGVERSFILGVGTSHSIYFRGKSSSNIDGLYEQ
jgi:hypothetical protein